MSFSLADANVVYVATDQIDRYENNPKLHDEIQLRMLEASVRRSKHLNPLLLTSALTIIAGHARYEVALRLGLAVVPVIILPHLTEADSIALRIADNAISEKGRWSLDLLSQQIELLSSIELDFNHIEIGFETPEIDRLILGRAKEAEVEAFVPEPERAEPSVSRPGDIISIGPHSIGCGDARDQDFIRVLLARRLAGAIITDMPWNLPACFISNNGRKQFSDFVMASGEMTDIQFRAFTDEVLAVQSEFARPGALIYQFIDWRSVEVMISSGRKHIGDLVNICVWVKQNGRMGSPYRSRHELVCVFRRNGGKARDNVRLGAFGRNRTNIWEYQAPSGIGGESDKLTMHPTCKNVQMIADAILDCTDRGDVILDPFLGSGTTLLAAHRTGRAGIGIELDPHYVDLAVRRCQEIVGQPALMADGATFDDAALSRRDGGSHE